MHHVVRKIRRLGRLLYVGGAAAVAALVFTIASPAAGGCAVCGKNLIKNPGAELGRGVMAVDAFGAVPGWSNESGQFGAASYAFPNGWFSARSQGPKDRGKTTSSVG